MLPAPAASIRKPAIASLIPGLLATWALLGASATVRSKAGAEDKRPAEAAKAEIGPAQLQEAEKAYRDVYGAEHDRVTASKSKADKVKFAQKLLDASKLAKDNPAFALVLAGKAADFAGADPSGNRIALEALRFQSAASANPRELKDRIVVLLELSLKTDKPAEKPKTARELVELLRERAAERFAADPPAAAALLTKAKEICRRNYKTADIKEAVAELDAEEKQFERDRKMAEEKARLVTILNAAPQDPKANVAMAMLLLHAGEPAKAADHLQRSEISTLQALGKLLASEQPASDGALADAYRAAAGEVPAEKPLLLGLARIHYEAAITKDPKHSDTARFKLILAELPKPAEPTAASKFDPTRVLELFDEDAGFPDRFGAKEAKLEIESKDHYSGKIALRVAGRQSYNLSVPGWNYKIVEKPEAGQYRFIRFAWKKQGGTSIYLRLVGSGSRICGYFAGVNSLKETAVILSEKVPDKWEVETRDLFKDFGPFVLTGASFCPVDNVGYFDHVYLGRTLEDLNRIPVRR